MFESLITSTKNGLEQNNFEVLQLTQALYVAGQNLTIFKPDATAEEIELAGLLFQAQSMLNTELNLVNLFGTAQIVIYEQASITASKRPF